MIRRFYLAVLFSFLCILSGCAPLAGKQLIGQPAPAVRMYHLEDSMQTFLSDYKGSYVAVVFWATTCRSSTPIVKRLGEYALKNKNNAKIHVIAVSLDKSDDLNTLKERVLYDHLNGMQQMFSGNEEYDEAYYGLKGERLPYVVVIDPMGKVIGVDTDDDIVYSLIK